MFLCDAQAFTAHKVNLLMDFFTACMCHLCFGWFVLYLAVEIVEIHFNHSINAMNIRWQTVLRQIYSTKNPFDLRCESATL